MKIACLIIPTLSGLMFTLVFVLSVAGPSRRWAQTLATHLRPLMEGKRGVHQSALSYRWAVK
jgi:hypothetical protein